MTIASDVIAKVSAPGVAAVTLYGGYLQTSAGRVVRFPTAHIEHEKRNADGRCTALRVRYADGSRLSFTWSKDRGARYRIV